MFWSAGRVYWIVETLGFVGGGLLGLATSRPRHATTVMPAVAAPSPFVRRWQAIVVAIFIAALAFDVVGMAGRYVACPQGGWDAWAIWNARARFLFRSGDDWRQAFHPAQAHDDYPLLVPMSNVRCWWRSGANRVGCPRCWAMGSLWRRLACWRRESAGCAAQPGLLAGTVLLGTKAFVMLGAAQYADVPLAFFILASVLLLALDDAAEQSSPGLVLLAGLCAGLAAWTKNEGLLFLVVVLFARCFMAWRRHGGRRAMSLPSC